ncbi:MAG: protein kinase [Candidatus Kuenenia sp.]|nr:protein kinase [Candidatus Kuenenia hertensis]
MIDTSGKGIKYAPYADFSGEYNVLKELNHKQIPKVYDIGQGELYRDERFLIKQNFIVLQHINGDDLVKYFNEKDVENSEIIDEVVKLFVTLCDPLTYLHNMNYIHCDIKPGHLIYNRETGLVHIIDFELAIKQGEILRGISREYASPEQLQILDYLRSQKEDDDQNSLPSAITLDGRTDLYSTGLLLYETLTKKAWQKGMDLPRKLNKRIPQKLEEIIMGLLEENVSNRISSAEKLEKMLLGI